MKKILISLAVASLISVSLFSLSPSLSVTNSVFATSSSENTASKSSASMTLTNPLGPNTTVYTLAGRIISVVLGLVGTIALVMFIYGGIIWMTSAGSKDKVKKGKDAIVWSVIGMAVIFASYGLTKFLLDNLTGR